MRTIFLLISLSLIAAGLSHRYVKKSFHSYTFDMYTEEFGRTYADEKEHLQRKQIFEENLKKINAVNSNPKNTWHAVVNQFTDKFSHEVKSKMGLNRALKFFNYKPSFHVPSRDVLHNLPDSIDWREKGVVTDPKDQASCGSCWAFSTAEVVESHIAIQTGKLLEFSEQQLVACTPNPDQCGGTGGCNGATQELGFAYFAKAGITTEDNWPYEGRDTQCDASKIKVAATIESFVKLPENDYNALMTAVVTQGPIAISVAASAWPMYGGGVYNGDCGTEINHAVVLVGYGTDPEDGNYWLVRNSWSNSWGENGYIRVAREKSAADVKCDIDYNPSAGSACKGGPDQITVCGLCGILIDSSYPTGGKLASKSFLDN